MDAIPVSDSCLPPSFPSLLLLYRYDTMDAIPVSDSRLPPSFPSHPSRYQYPVAVNTLLFPTGLYYCLKQYPVTAVWMQFLYLTLAFHHHFLLSRLDTSTL
ncbi:hypothetical protein J6590_092026 [Homalodisca vitripennis]|nr:hypothetical protein J6590_092026 [Homalodisca vitripennis]